MGITSVSIHATASATAGTGAACVLCVMSSSGTSLQSSGNGSVTVTGGGAVVDSSSCPALSLSGNGGITATSIGVVGCVRTSGNGTLTPAARTGISPVQDPLAAVPVPALTCPPLGGVALSANGSQTISPGIYSTIAVSGNGSLTLDPGVYVITGSLSTSGDGNLIGQGVTLYFACVLYPLPCVAGQAGASLSLSGNGSYHQRHLQGPGALLRSQQRWHARHQGPELRTASPGAM